MPIVDTDLLVFSPANVPEDDATTSGGARSTTSRPTLTQLSAASVVAVISDGADVRDITVTGRLPNGTVDTEVITLTGAVEAVGAKTFERLLNVVASGTDAARTVEVREGAGGTVRATITPNETTRHIMFQQSASDAVPVARYEKQFWLNNHATIALTSSALMLTADPSAKIEMGVATAIDDAGSVADRLTAPGGVTFVDDNVSQSVPGGVLDAGEAIGVWIEQSLAADDTPYKSTFTTRLSGQTT